MFRYETVTVASDPFFLIFFDRKAKTNIVVATKDIEGPEGRFRKEERYKPVIEDIVPKRTLTPIDTVNVSVTSFAAAAGIISILKTKIIPTVCKDPTIAIDNRIKKR